MPPSGRPFAAFPPALAPAPPRAVSFAASHAVAPAPHPAFAQWGDAPAAPSPGHGELVTPTGAYAAAAVPSQYRLDRGEMVWPPARGRAHPLASWPPSLAYAAAVPPTPFFGGGLPLCPVSTETPPAVAAEPSNPTAEAWGSEPIPTPSYVRELEQQSVILWSTQKQLSQVLSSDESQRWLNLLQASLLTTLKLNPIQQLTTRPADANYTERDVLAEIDARYTAHGSEARTASEYLEGVERQNRLLWETHAQLHALASNADTERWAKRTQAAITTVLNLNRIEKLVIKSDAHEQEQQPQQQQQSQPQRHPAMQPSHQSQQAQAQLSAHQQQGETSDDGGNADSYHTDADANFRPQQQQHSQPAPPPNASPSSTQPSWLPNKPARTQVQSATHSSAPTPLPSHPLVEALPTVASRRRRGDSSTATAASTATPAASAAVAPIIPLVLTPKSSLSDPSGPARATHAPVHSHEAPATSFSLSGSGSAPTAGASVGAVATTAAAAAPGPDSDPAPASDVYVYDDADSHRDQNVSHTHSESHATKAPQQHRSQPPSPANQVAQAPQQLDMLAPLRHSRDVATTSSAGPHSATFSASAAAIPSSLVVPLSPATDGRPLQIVVPAVGGRRRGGGGATAAAIMRQLAAQSLTAAKPS